MLLDFEVKMRNGLWRAGENFKKFLKNEEGDTNVISIIIILVIVIGLAAVFKDKIAELLEKLWNAVNKKADDVQNW